MNAQEILKIGMKQLWFTGLYCDDCSCRIDDLEPCGNINLNKCIGGFVVYCNKCDKRNTENCTNSEISKEENGFCVITEKEFFDLVGKMNCGELNHLFMAANHNMGNR